MIPNARGHVMIHENAIKELIGKENVDINQELRINDDMIQQYADSFIEMAQLGFISMDLGETERYYKIAEPTDQQVPYKVMELLPEVDQESLSQTI